MQQITRLLDRFSPNHYDLSVTLDRLGRSFHGTVTINGEQEQANLPIGVHAKDLTISTVTIDGKSASWNLEGDELYFEQTDIGDHIIVIGFSGTITDSMHGLYPCYYDHDGQKKELLATQFESHHAREAFPCIDEPAAKATFSVTLTTEQNVTVLGNMPVSDQRVEGDSLVTWFEETPRMSTYLLAWVVGELHKASGHTKTGVEVNIWATPAQPAASLTFALDIATRSIDFFDEYFETPYPLPKSDHVALPDFSSGAMENWGLITYREVALLADPEKSSLDTKRQVALVIAHELSHQWFGNLVTMEWWNDLWLNESFANMMEYVAIDHLEPSWQVWLDHASAEVIQALRRDSLDGVQAIQTEVNHPDEIATLFDPSIVYAKGGRLLRMLQSYIGDEAMQTGLKAYFKEHAYKNTVADDLWASLGEASGHDIPSLMHAWISQSGYPVVHVKKDNGTVTLRQEQFFVGEHQPSTKLWPIPLASTNADVPDLLNDSETSFALTESHDIQLNHNSVSHFITHYGDKLFPVLLDELHTYGDIDRLKLITEHVLLAQGELISSADLIPLLERYDNEATEAVWSLMSLALNDLKKFTEFDDEVEKILRSFAGSLAEKQYRILGWHPKHDETDEDTKLRSVIIALMLYSERDDVQQRAAELFASHDIEDLDPNLRVAIMANAVKNKSPENIIDVLMGRHNSTTSSELREDIVAALTATRDPETISRLLSYVPDQSIVRRQDVTRWVIWLMSNRFGRTITWQWVRDNWHWFETTFQGDKSYDVYPRYIASILRTPEEKLEYIEFFAPLKNQAALRRNIEIGITELSHRVNLLEREGPAVRDALRKLNDR